MSDATEEPLVEKLGRFLQSNGWTATPARLAGRPDAAGWALSQPKLEVTFAPQKRELTFECAFEEPPDYDPDEGPLEDAAWIIVDDFPARSAPILDVIARHQASLNRQTWTSFVSDLLATGAHLENEHGDVIASAADADLAVSKLEFEPLSGDSD